MGCGSSKHHGSPSPNNNNTVSLAKTNSNSNPHAKQASLFRPIKDKFQSLDEVQNALRQAGLESSNLVIGVDYTKSNTWNGAKTFGGRCLHQITPGQLNPYQEAIAIVGETLSVFDDDNLIPVYGFGDSRTTDKSVFKFTTDRPCFGFQEVLNTYNEITPLISLSGPTSFAPLIREAINIVAQTRQYHILVIIADGEVTVVNETTKAIVEASSYPLSIITIGVGDGPFDLMEKFDDELPERKFDNFQFVNYNTVMSRAENRKVDFAVAALQEIPEQFAAIKQLGLLAN
ncbi:hypothetical protein PPL_01023 [Heterostelium album PN500]|uniref:VWFA domain-containing protein n=1 Tax=Heterostelium pallidum (strain ATCC 26659 / Pp 5 / PN500) TaxID=670386 RepID=D3AXW6_HETP5|nr:hypothetical protein PPL_01023 [Heterostelium album PN500]EFA85793.1 hypothetical protein PPL_01023 [Heterostelium album PN500]|eukprot:XP_020437899.1 hypothetical protein PPL_01023 [Heterostelium album PN500]